MMRLSVVIIGYNSWNYLKKCFASLPFLLDNPDVEIIYVDNASTDATIPEMKQMYPSVILIENSRNAGISVARNQGMRRASGDYIWLLDSDTEVNGEALNVMLDFMDSHLEAGLCGCKMYGQDGQVQESCRHFPSVREKIKAAGRIFVKKGHLNIGSLLQSPNVYDTDSELPFEVDYVIGACQLIRRTALEKTGFLDERIFYGPEDADFCFRLQRLGYKVYYLPNVSIYHAYQRVSSHKIFSTITFKHFQGLIYYFWKHRK
jgi:GT2 family glycosyltransferase